MHARDIDVASRLHAGLGRCPTCMKTAFLCSSLCWLAALGWHFLRPGDGFGPLITLIAIAMTSLWLLHFVVYTGRILRMLRSEYVLLRPPARSPAGHGSITRREMLWTFGSAVGLGLAAAVWLPGDALAAGSRCGDGYCPDDAPRCCSRSQGKCCNGNWACTKTGTCHDKHADARRQCGRSGIVWACT